MQINGQALGAALGTALAVRTGKHRHRVFIGTVHYEYFFSSLSKRTIFLQVVIVFYYSCPTAGDRVQGSGFRV